MPGLFYSAQDAERSANPSLETATPGARSHSRQTPWDAFEGSLERRLESFGMSRAPTLKSSFLLGFDEIERAVERVAKSASDGYPPYNIERIAGDRSAAVRLRITLAVAGFSADQLEITVEKAQLAIRGRQKEEKERVHLYRGIAARQFQRVFRFAEAMEVAEATLRDGLLSVELVRPEPESNVQKVEINVRD